VIPIRRPLAKGLLLLAGWAAIASVAGCSSSTPTPEAGVRELGTTAPATRHDVVARLADQVIVPGYRSLADATAALQRELERVCAAPVDAAGLASVQQAWRVADEAWWTTAAYRFGPATDQRAAAAIDFAIDSAKIDKLLAATDPPTPITPDRLDDTGADVRGLAGVEHVLFSPGAPADLDARRCSYALAAATLAATAAADVSTAWERGEDGERSFRDQLVEPGDGGMWAGEQEVIADLVNGSIAALGTVADMGLGRASGDVTGTPEPDVDSGRAHALLDGELAVIAGVDSMFHGADGAGGLNDLVRIRSNPTVTRLDRQLADSADAIRAIPAPLATVPVDGLGPVKTAYEQVRATRITYRTEVASQLGVTLSFSDSDGDS
jgi:predicted lipoprotein